MFEPFTVETEVLRFEGPSGWTYVPFGPRESAALRMRVNETWPALLKVAATLNGHRWTATVMPIADGPLFIALTAPVRKRLGIGEGDRVAVRIEPVEGRADPPALP